jgi:hypothetical protein
MILFLLWFFNIFIFFIFLIITNLKIIIEITKKTLYLIYANIFFILFYLAFNSEKVGHNIYQFTLNCYLTKKIAK